MFKTRSEKKQWENEEEAAVSGEISEEKRKCTRLSAQTADKSARFLLSQPKEGLFTARNATESTGNSNSGFRV